MLGIIEGVIILIIGIIMLVVYRYVPNPGDIVVKILGIILTIVGAAVILLGLFYGAVPAIGPNP